METKPYNIQSPEDIAKEYGGNKQRIAQAAQMGMLDPTAAVLAGMFIDRMRTAQVQEQVPQQTVAQQVFAPPQMPQQPQQPTGAGLGATPQAAQLAQAYPADGAPPPIPGPSMPQQPMMAAEGGLLALPIDDGMFESHYAGGGIVAFARGSDEGGVADERERTRLRRQMQERFGSVPEVMRQISAMSAEDMRRALGEVEAAPVAPVMDMNAAPIAPMAEPVAAVTPPVVMDKGPAANVLAATQPPAASIEEAAVAANPQAAQQAVAQGGAPGLQAYVDQYKAMLGQVPEGQGMQEYRKYLEGLPQEMAGRKKEDLYTALTQFGFNLAGSQSPYFLQAAGQAGAQVVPTMASMTKERRAAEAEARKGRAELDKMDRAEQLRAIEGGTKLFSEDEARRQARELKELELKNAREIAEMNRKAQLQAAGIQAGKKTDMQTYAADVLAASKGDKDAQIRVDAVNRYLPMVGTSGARAQTAATAQDIEVRAKATELVQDSISMGGANAEEFRKRTRADQAANRASGAKPGDPNYQDTAEAYRRQLLDAAIRDLTPASAAPTPAAPSAPTAPTAPTPAAARPTPPSAAVNMLRSNPSAERKRQFDEIYGPGAADRALAAR